MFPFWIDFPIVHILPWIVTGLTLFFTGFVGRP